MECFDTSWISGMIGIGGMIPSTAGTSSSFKRETKPIY